MSIPQNLLELKDLKQWVNYVRTWNATKNGGRGGYDKPPINAHTLWDARTNDSTTWATYSEAEANKGKTATHKDSKHKDEYGFATTVRESIEGAGLVLANGYCGVDFDHVLDESGNVPQWVTEILNTLDTYIEISPSGTGLHGLLYCGDLLEAGRSFSGQFTLTRNGEITSEAAKECELEIYFPTTGGRYFTVTGNVYRDRPINRNAGQKLIQIFESYLEKRSAYNAALHRSQSVGTHYSTPGRAATGEDDRRMIDSALNAINPGDLDFGAWAAIGSALKQLGYSCDDWEAWSSCNGTNIKHVANYTFKRWNKLQSKEEPARLIVGIAKRFGWNAAEAFDDEARAEYGRSLYSEEARAAYGRSLHTEEERRQYGRRLHEERLNKWWENQAVDFQTWKARTKNPQSERPAQPSEVKKITLDELRARRKKG